jgi:CRP/FNR family transcriptional regulator, transcriptional activator FtrB
MSGTDLSKQQSNRRTAGTHELTIIKWSPRVRSLQPSPVTMRSTDLDQIRQLPLFADIEPAHFKELVAGAFLQRFPPRMELIREGDLPDFLHIVVEGNVEVYGTLEDAETALAILGADATFIVAAVVRDEVYLTSARTLDTARILMIPAAAVRAVFDKDAAFARAVVGDLAGRYRQLVRDIKGNKLRSGLERLANYLLRLQVQRGGKGPIDLPVEKRTLASYLGMAPENLSRAFVSLAEHGVTVSGNKITITDKAALRRLARPQPLIDDPAS